MDEVKSTEGSEIRKRGKKSEGEAKERKTNGRWKKKRRMKCRKRRGKRKKKGQNKRGMLGIKIISCGAQETGGEGRGYRKKG